MKILVGTDLARFLCTSPGSLQNIRVKFLLVSRSSHFALCSVLSGMARSRRQNLWDFGGIEASNPMPMATSVPVLIP